MPSEPPDADPHVRWCGRRRGEPGAYPIALPPPGKCETRAGSNAAVGLAELIKTIVPSAA